MKNIILGIVLALITFGANAKENDLNIFHCNNYGGNFDSKFADCETKTEVIEGEYIYNKAKVYEAIGQILYYGSETNKQMIIWAYKKPGKENKFNKYYEILINTIQFHNLPIKVVIK